MASKDKITLSLAKEALAQTSLNDEEKESILIKLGLIADEAGEAAAQEFCTQKDIEALVAQGLLNEEQKEGILAILGLDSANKSASVSIGLFTKEIWANIKSMLAWMVSNPFGQIMLGATLLMGAVGIIDLLTTSVEEHREQLSDLKSEYSEIKSELDSVNSELESTQNKIKELEGKDKLTFTEAEELENLRKQNNELKRQNDLLEMQEKIKAKEVNDKFIETMNADAGEIEFASGKIQSSSHGYTYSVADTNEKEHSFVQIEELSILNDKMKDASDEEKEIIERKIQNIKDYLEKKNKEWAENAEGIEYIQNPTTEDDKKVNEWLDFISDFQDKMAIAMGGDNAKENAFNRLVDNWKFDSVIQELQDLGKEGKVTFDMLTDSAGNVLPQYREFIDNLIKIGFISDDSEESLKFVANAFNGVGLSAHSARQELQKYIKTKGDIAKYKINTAEDIKQLIALANAAGASESALQRLAIMMQNLSPDASRDAKVRGLYTKRQIEDGTFDFGFVELNPDDYIEDNSPYTPSGDKDKGSSKNEALDNYLKDAENRYKIHQDETKYINDLNYALNNLVKTKDEELDVTGKINEAYRDLADNRIKDLEHRIDLTKELHGENADVITQLNEIQKVANEEAHRLRAMGYDDNSNEIQDLQKTWWDAQNSKLDFYNKQHEIIIRDIEHARDMALEANPFAGTTSYYKQMQEEYHKEAERLRALDPEKYSEDIQALQLAWHDAQNAIADWSYTNSENWIALRNTYNDWEKFGDSEAEAWKRVLDRFKKEFPNELDKIREIEENYYNAIKDEVNEILDLNKSRIESQKTLMQSYYDVTNSIAEAQHEINKELKASKTMYDYLDESTRKLLFNQKDYNILADKLVDIQAEADKLQRKYNQDILGATADNLDEITSKYQMQYDIMMKQYEIAKAELEVAKKRQQLDNVLNERNVRMFINGQWQWVANTQDVIDAQNELADAKFEAQQALVHKEQTESMNELTSATDKFTTIMNEIDSGAIDLRDGIGDITSSLNRVATETVPALRDVINNTKSALQSFSSGAYSGSSSTGSSGSSYSSGRVLQVGSDGNAPAGATIGDIIQTAGGNYKVVAAGTSGATYNPASGLYSIKVGTVSSGSSSGSSSSSKTHPVTANKNGINISTVYLKQKKAKGTGYTQSGSMLAGEDGEEIFIDNNGHLIPVVQPTVFKDIEAGGKVFNGLQMKNLESLWNLSNVGFNHSLPAMVERNQSVSSVDNSIHIGGITIPEQGNEDWINGLRRYVYTHKGSM